MTRLRLTIFLVTLSAGSALAQTTRYTMTDGTTIDLPDLIITGSTLDCTVSYDANRAVYRYAYTLSAPATNRVAVQSFKIDLSGTTARTQSDPTLAENIVRSPAIQ